MAKELTPRQLREQEAYEAQKAKPRETAADRRNFYRRQAGWPIKENN